MLYDSYYACKYSKCFTIVLHSGFNVGTGLVLLCVLKNTYQPKLTNIKLSLVYITNGVNEILLCNVVVI